MAATVPILRADGTEVIKVRIPPTGKLVKSIFQVLEKYGLPGALEADGVSVSDEDMVFPGDHLVHVPPLNVLRAGSVAGAISALPYFSSPLRPSKKLKASFFQGKTRCLVLHEIIGAHRLDATVALNWLWLHLFGASPNLSIYLSSLHEERYYPYVLSILQAAAVSDDQNRVEITGRDKNKTNIPDLQVIIDGKDVVPLEVKHAWAHGSVDDPDGIATNSDTLSELLGYVLNYNKNRVGNYSCLTALIIRVQCMVFLRFNIRKNAVNDLGSLELLEYAPGFTRGSSQMAAEAGLPEVNLVNMADVINAKFGLNRTWSVEVLQDMKLPHSLADRLQNTSFQELLPACPPEGFHSLVKYFRTVAPHCYSEVQFVYESRDGSAEVSRVLASGPKSCVFATAGMSSVIKVSSGDYVELELDIRAHFWGGSSDCIYLRKMTGHGRVVGAGPGLRFVELEGVGIPFAKKHVSSAEQVLKCWTEASLAVKALHGHKVFHRDIKPNNFIVMDQGTARQRLVLNDFDCAAHWDESMAVDVGTPMFRSPLLDEGGDYCCRDDWLSLGLTFAYLLGIFPERLESNKQRKLEILEEFSDHASLPEDMKKTIKVALSEEHVSCKMCRVNFISISP